MPAEHEKIKCRYHYDPLDRMVGYTPVMDEPLQRFYCKNRLVTEIQGQVRRSIVQQGEQLLAQQQREGGKVETLLLGSDLQRSILKALKDEKRHQLTYTPYGHNCESGVGILLAFNGERPDPLTGHYLLGNGYRAFNPVLMRFNSPDSWSPFGRGGLNPYAYCLGDPINLGDSNGHRPGFIARITSMFRRKKLGYEDPLSLNAYNPGDFVKRTNPLSPEDMAMASLENKFGAMSGNEIKKYMKRGSMATSVQDWDLKTGVSNMEFHVDAAAGSAQKYDVISEGIAGNLNGVLPERAKEYSQLVSEGKYPYPVLSGVKNFYNQKTTKPLMLDLHRQFEIYRQANMPVPDFLLKDNIMVPARLAKIRKAK